MLGLYPSQGPAAVISTVKFKMDQSTTLTVHIKVHSEIRSHSHYWLPHADAKPSTTRLVDPNLCDLL